MEITYRQYTGIPFDIWDLQTLAIAYNDEANRFSQIKFCERHVSECARLTVGRGDSAIFFAMHGEKPVGGIWVSSVQAIHTPSLIGVENFNFVMPEYRDQGIGLKLASMGIEWLRNKEVAYIQFGLNSGIKHGSKNPYESLGFKPIGVNFILM